MCVSNWIGTKEFDFLIKSFLQQIPHKQLIFKKFYIIRITTWNQFSLFSHHFDWISLKFDSRLDHEFLVHSWFLRHYHCCQYKVLRIQRSIHNASAEKCAPVWKYYEHEIIGNYQVEIVKKTLTFHCLSIDNYRRQIVSNSPNRVLNTRTQGSWWLGLSTSFQPVDHNGSSRKTFLFPSITRRAQQVWIRRRLIKTPTQSYRVHSFKSESQCNTGECLVKQSSFICNQQFFPLEMGQFLIHLK